MGRVLAAATVAAGVLALSACSAAGGSGVTPEGFTRADGSKVSVAFPHDWRRTQDTSIPVSVQAPGQTAFIEVVEDLSEHGSADGLVAISQAGPTMNAKDYRRTSTSSIKTAGAKAAERIDYTFSDFHGAGGPGQAVDVALLAKDDHVHVVRITWQRGELDDRTIDGIIGSIEVS
jgi:hypothetical protein